MRSCCAEPSEGVGVREAETESPAARCGRWLSDLLHRLCPCLPRSPEPEYESTIHGTKVPKVRDPWTRVRRKWRKRSARVGPAPNTSQSAPEATLLPDHADHPTTGQRLPWSWPGSAMGDALTDSSCDGGHDEGPENELRIPRTGLARRLPWEPESAPAVHHDSQPSSTLEGQVLHHLVQEEHLGPTVAELEALRQNKQRWRCRYLSCQLYLQPLKELPETPVLELHPASPASVPAEMEDVPAVSSVPVLAVSTGDIPGVVSSPELEPLEPSGPGLRAPAGMAPGLIEPEADPEPTSPCAASTPCAVREEPPTILQFTPRLVAEQLTLMCAELFTKLTYSEWKANLWHQAPTRTIEHLAPTIHQIRQSGATANVVTSSCLGAPSMTDRDRARVVEFWIWVAKECLALRNFAALHAILLALQCPAIRRLESTWRHVSWKSSWIYKKLKNTDKGVNRKQHLKEATATMMQQLWAPKGSQDMKKQGMVPFLGVFLDDLLADKLLKHRENVTDILDEIMAYKGVATLYDLDPEKRFLSFFRSVEPLDEQQSYNLSCELEPEGQRAGRKWLLQFFKSDKI